MPAYVIGPDVAWHLARHRVKVPAEVRLLAPTLIRDQLLNLLYQAVRRGELTRADANRDLDFVRGLRVRLLGDRVLQQVAWTIAEELGRPETFDAEYLALTRLHGDAFVTCDADLALAVRDVVPLAAVTALGAPAAG